MILIVFGRAAQFVLLLLTMRLATTYLHPEEMGRLSLLTATTALFTLFLVNPVGGFINRRLHTWESLGRTRFYFWLHWLYLLAVSIFVALVLVVLNSAHSFDFQVSTKWLVILVCGSLLFNTINQTVIPSLNLFELRKSFIVLTLAAIATSLVTALLLVREFGASAENWLLGLLIGQIVFAITGSKIFFSKLRVAGPASRPGRPHLRTLFAFAWPVAVSVGFTWMQTQSYRFFVADSLGLVALGLFVAGYGISAGLISAFESVVTTYFQPRFYKAISTNDTADQARAWREYTSAILPALMLVLFALIALAPELTSLMVGPSYKSASQYVVWGVLAEGARVVAGVYSLSAHARMKTRLLLLPNLVGALICLALIWVLPNQFGAHGVGMALAFAGFGVIACMHRILVEKLDMDLPYRLLLQGALMGAGLLLTASTVRLLLSGANQLLSACLLVGTVGLMFLPMFYWLISSFLPRHDKT